MSLDRRGNRRKIKKNRSVVPMLIAVVFLVVMVGVMATFFELGDPDIVLQKDISRLGLTGEIALTAKDASSGIRSLEVYFEQDGKQYEVFRKSFIREDHFPYSGPKTIKESQSVNIKALGVDEGKATLVVNARDFSLWGWFDGNRVIEKYPVLIDTRPPTINVTAHPKAIKAGSAGVVVYKVNEPLTKQGIFINGYFFPGYPLISHGKGVYGAVIGLPIEVKNIKTSYVMAVDLTANESHAPFGMTLQDDKGQADRINISDGFLNRKIPEFEKHYPNIPGTFLEKYIYINNKVRAENNRRIKEICSSSVPERLWEGPFLRMAGSSRRAGFGDRRTYYYHDREIDRQIHMGVDLASVRFAEIRAANRGKVAFADYLGIYGNAVILDHGLGVFSLYGHMSQLSAVVGTIVEKNGVIGLSGTTGMAGGDHLHFSMLVNGVFVDPVEWWDGKWLRYNIINPL